jgi:methionyl-tRNA formyltransferase
MNSLRIIFAGSGAFGLPTLQAIISAQHEIVQVITQPDRPAGRGRKLTPTPIGEFAIQSNLPLVRTENINTLALPDADVMVVIAFGQKIAPHQVNHPRLGSVNLHASLLPKYRGAAPINWAILNGETETGNSVIRLAEKMDAGAILAQSHLAIGPLETAGELHNRLAADGGPLISKVLQELAMGKEIERVQDESLATIAKKLTRQTAALDFNLTAEEIARKIRGLHPWPGCRVRLLDPLHEIARLMLVRAAPSFDNLGEGTGGGDQSGTITSTGTITCGSGEIEIVELQPEGKNPMTLAAYQNGHPWAAGAKIESAT